MAAPTEIVAQHLNAVWRSDWGALDRSLSGDARLLLAHISESDFEWTVGGLYRHITQAWDFYPGEVQLRDCGDGMVAAQMVLTNGADWVKNVEGEYLVTTEGISRIRLVDGEPFECIPPG